MSSPVPSIAEVDVPAAGTWHIDPGHAEVAFIGRHFGLTKIRGRFTGVQGEITIAPDLASSVVSVDIDMASVSSGDPTRDDHLRSADFFDVGNHPVASFRSTRIRANGRSGTLSGELTIKGVTRPIDLDVDFLGAARDPWGNERTVFTSSTTIDREDWGLTWNILLEAGGLLVSKQIRLEIDVELVRAD